MGGCSSGPPDKYLETPRSSRLVSQIPISASAVLPRSASCSRHEADQDSNCEGAQAHETDQPEQSENADQSEPEIMPFVGRDLSTLPVPHPDPSVQAGVHEIIPRLYISGHEYAEDLEALKRLDIRYVLNVSAEHDTAHADKFHHLRIRLEDEVESDLLSVLHEGVDFIHHALSQEAGGVFVHCLAGVSRSVTFVLAYLMRHRNMTLIDAYWLVKRRRWCASPNAGFMSCLIEYEEQLYGEGSATVNAQHYRWKRFQEPFCYKDMERRCAAAEDEEHAQQHHSEYGEGEHHNAADAERECKAEEHEGEEHDEQHLNEAYEHDDHYHALEQHGDDGREHRRTGHRPCNCDECNTVQHHDSCDLPVDSLS